MVLYEPLGPVAPITFLYYQYLTYLQFIYIYILAGFDSFYLTYLRHIHLSVKSAKSYQSLSRTSITFSVQRKFNWSRDHSQVTYSLLYNTAVPTDLVLANIYLVPWRQAIYQ